MSILGTRVLRTEDPGFLTTGGVYTDDVVDERLAGACHVFFVRSPIAHARIRSVDVSAALEAPGVIAAFTGADLADLPPLAPPMPDLINERMAQPLLARDVVRYVGEPVAVVVTEDPYQGEDAAELVDVDYDPLPAVVDLAGAADDPPSLLFPEAGTNVTATFGDAAALQADLFDGCEVVVSRTIINQRVAPAPMETRAAAAAWGDDGRLTAWIPNQGAQGTRGALAAMLAIDPASLRIITPDVGGAFGAKFGADPEHAVVCWVARQLGRPARWTETRNENLIAMTHGRAQRQTVTIGGSRDGTVPAYRLEILQDAGAYPRIGAFLPVLTILMAPGPYAIGRAEAVARSVVTTTTPVGAYRGAGRPEATAAIERAIDLFAAEIGLDPAEVRRQNLLPKFTEPHRTAFGALYDTGDYVAALDAALDAAGYAALREEQARRRAARRRGPARHRPGQLRGDHRRRGGVGCPPGERQRRGASRRQRDDPHRDLPARAGPRDRVGHAGQRGTRHPGGQDHGEVGGHRPDPRRAAAPAARAACSRAGSRCSRPHGSCSRWPGSGPPRCSRPTPPTWSSSRSAARSRWPVTRTRRCRWPRWPRRSGWWCAPCSSRRARPSPSGRTWPSSRWTPRPARWCCAGW